MTAIISWLSQERGTSPFLITVGDTKISSGGQTLTLEGAKILELPIRCKDLTTPIQEVYYLSSIGFGFAGSTLVGLNVYCYLQTIFSNLGGLKSEDNRPDYKSLSEKARDILYLYSQSIASGAEVLLFGFCPKFNTPFISSIKPTFQNEAVEYSLEIKDNFTNQLEYVLLGDKKDKISELIETELSTTGHSDTIDYWRAPARVLKKIIEKGLYETIGGNLQIATCNIFRLDMHSVVLAQEGQEPKWTMKFRNLDVFDDIGHRVGECLVAINGLTID